MGLDLLKCEYMAPVFGTLHPLQSAVGRPGGLLQYRREKVIHHIGKSLHGSNAIVAGDRHFSRSHRLQGHDGNVPQWEIGG